MTACLMGAGQSFLFAADSTNSTAVAPPLKVAIIVRNEAGSQFDKKISVLEDLVGSQIASKGYSVISRHIVTKALSGQTNELDNALNDNASALQLAQNLGADYILVPTITSYDTDQMTYNSFGMATPNITHTLRVSYKIVETRTGGSIRGGTVVATKIVRHASDSSTKDSDFINGLLDDAAGQLADTIE
jgi:hypothetical protein